MRRKEMKLKSNKSKINKQSKEIFTNKNGITIIALVITIILLLILSGVTIATLTRNNGILTRANDAKTNTEQAEEDELRKLTQAEAATYLEEHEYADESGETVTIPAKCAVSQVEGENTLEDGLVIIDANGNEWVWIEVPESVTASSTTDEEIENALISYATNYRGSYADTWYNGCGLGEQKYADRYSEMLRSIKANNGFFIGRYEVGSFDNPVTSNNNTRQVVIQKGAYPYNYVTCSQAEDLAEGLAPDKGTTSSLMFGIQWDLVLKYLETKGVSESELKTNSGSWGNYRDVEFPVERENKYAIATNFVLGEWNDVPVNYPKPTFDTDGNGVLLSTGATERNSKMNIYDFAGNVHEWTLEKSTDTGSPCVGRGGFYRNSGSDYPASSRGYFSTSGSSSRIGFRPALY